MEKQFEILKAGRLIILNIFENLSLNQINKIPDGFKNNLIWNAAHLIVTQQLLCYKLSNLPLSISEDMVKKYAKGTAPKKEISIEEFNTIKTLLVNLVDKTESDYATGIFNNYLGYQPSTANVYLGTIEDAIQFNNFHEGMHLGIIFALKKLV